MKMKAARLHGYGEALSLDEVDRPGVGPGEVLVRVGGSGFCHSDLHLMDGDIQVLPGFPVTLGHENAGTVAEVGPGVTAVKEGDSVVVFGGWGCGHCNACVLGEEQLCAEAAWAGLSANDGGYAEYLKVPRERYLVKLDSLDPRTAAVYTDAALTPYRAVKKALPHLPPGEADTLVIGIGGLGQFAVKLLKVLTPARVIAVDRDETKLATARSLGADETLQAGSAEELVERVRDLTGGHGVRCAFDVVGTDDTLEVAVRSSGTGGHVYQLGLGGGTARIKVLENSPFEVSFQVPLWGSILELREVMALAESGVLPPIPLEYHPLEEINGVADRLRRGEIEGRAVITP